MGNGVGTIIILLLVLAFFIALFTIVDFLTKSKKATKKAEKPKPAPDSVSAKNKVSTDITKDEPVKIDAGSALFNDIELLIPEQSKKEERPEVAASERSRMYNRRARMMEYYDKKYKSRTVEFDTNSFDEPISNNPQSSLVVDGIEITQDDVRKLTALQGLLARKTGDSQ